MGSVLMPSFLAGGLPVVLTAAEMTQATALLGERAALGDWQSAAVLKRMVEGRGDAVRGSRAEAIPLSSGLLHPLSRPRHDKLSAMGLGDSFRHGADNSQRSPALRALMRPSPATSLFQRLPPASRQWVLEAFLKEALANPVLFRITARHLVPILTAEENTRLSDHLRRAAFSPGDMGRQKAAAEILLKWLDLSRSPAAENRDANGQEKDLGLEYLRFHPPGAGDAGKSVSERLCSLAFETVGDIAWHPRPAFPWGQAGLVRCLSASLWQSTSEEENVILQRLAEAYGKCAEDETLTGLETLFMTLPVRHLARVMAYLICLPNLAVSFQDRLFNFLPKLLARIDEKYRMTCIEKVEAAARATFVKRDGRTSLSRYPGAVRLYRWLPQAQRWIESVDNRQRMVIVGRRLYRFLQKNEHNRSQTADLVAAGWMRKIVADFSAEQKSILFGEMLRAAQSREEAAEAMGDALELLQLRAPENVLEWLNGIFAKDFSVAGGDIVFFEKFKTVGGRCAYAGLPEEQLSGLTPVLRLLIELDRHALRPEMPVLQAIQAQDKPFEYLAAKLGQLEKLFGPPAGDGDTEAARFHFFYLSVILDQPEQNRNHDNLFSLAASVFRQLCDAEEKRRKAKQPQRISTEQRTQLVRKMTEAVKRWEGDWTAEFFEILPALMGWLTPDIRIGLARASGDVGETVSFFNAGLPLRPKFYAEWRNAPDKPAYVQQVAASLRHYRQGGALPEQPSEQDIQFAYAALDNPMGPHFSEFGAQMPHPGPPPVFLDRTFSLQLSSEELAGAIHKQLDKGFLQKGWRDIPKWEEGGLTRYLKTVLAEPKRHGLSPLLKELAALLTAQAAPGQKYENHVDVLHDGNALQIAAAILKIVSAFPDDAFRERVQIQKVVTQLVLALAWVRPEAKGFKETALAFQRAIASEKLFVLVKQLETFYADSVAGVLKPFPNLKSKEIEKYREQLARQRAKIMTVRGEEESVTVWPWASQLAIFFGSIAQDCNDNYVAREALYGGQTPSGSATRFQVNLLENGRQIMGLVYLKEAVLDGRRVLVMAIQPRAVWKIDRKELLEKLVATFAGVAEEEGYDALVFSGGPHQNIYGQISNDLDLLGHIKAKNFPVWNTRNVLGGHVMTGNTFVILWRRENG